jgi:hypothetical protein
VRKDISVEQQLVQACHASCVAGERFGGSDSHMVLLGIDNSEELERLSFELSFNEIDFVTFFEPDNNMGDSSIATKPLIDEERQKIKKIISKMDLKLWSN